MIVSCTVLELLVLHIDILTDCLRLTEIERSSRHICNLTCWNEHGVYGSGLRCIDVEHMVIDGAVALSLEVEE